MSHSNPAVLEERINNHIESTEAYRAELRQVLSRIEAQTARTNGRVTRLEAWRMFVLGGFAALSAPWALKVASLLSNQ